MVDVLSLETDTSPALPNPNPVTSLSLSSQRLSPLSSRISSVVSPPFVSIDYVNSTHMQQIHFYKGMSPYEDLI